MTEPLKNSRNFNGFIDKACEQEVAITGGADYLNRYTNN